MTKYVYSFEEGNKEMKELLGGKGANLAEMSSIGVPVPPGFTIITEACHEYSQENKWPEGLKEEVDEKLEELQKKLGKTLGDKEDPLLVSVRSGAAVSMPGMMDTVLNLGLNDDSVLGIAEKTGNERFAWDSYRRFIHMFGNVVMGMKHDHFEHILEDLKKTKGVNYDTELDKDDLKTLVQRYKEKIKEVLDDSFPQDPKKQLDMAIDAVFGSWNNERAVLYRKLNDITGLLGTAVNIQSMVFGNMGESSGTGVAFTRNPSTGEKKIYGEFLMNAQGEDVVAGIRTPKEITELKEISPDCYNQFIDISEKLEKHYKDMQDMEFTIQEGKLFFLQTRTGKRTAAAAVKIAVDMLDEGLIDKKIAVLRVDPNSLNQLLHKQLDPVAKDKAEAVAKGLAASPGAAVGKVVFDAKKAHELNEEGEKVILVRVETSPEDLIGMNASQGILTSRGGMTSHAAVVARGMGKCCVAGCEEVVVDYSEGKFKVNDKEFKEGDWISLDGGTGEVFEGQIPTVDPDLSGDFGKLMEWADSFRKLGVRTNADTPKDAEVAVKFGAEGIGLCRTEHMFFEGERIKAMREMILSKKEEDRRKALDKLLPFQKQDFEGLFKALNGKPVTIRLLDPPLHEFLPKEEKEIKGLANDMGIDEKEIKSRIESLYELNPMLGHRGCRLGITYNEITEMQTKAIIEAAVEVKKEGIDIVPEIMIPLVGNVLELRNQKEVVIKTADTIISESGIEMKYLVGTMIEVPRGALTADKVAEEADFFSFGTNDLTQMTLGFSRDDTGAIIKEYLEKGIYEKDPFQAIDQEGVGEMVKIAVEKGRKTKANLKLGICGEHGGEPSSIDFCHRMGLNYISCSPFRVPIARLAAAHAALNN